MNLCQRGFPDIAPMIEELKRFHKATKRKTIHLTKVTGLDGKSAYAKMLEILPTRTMCDFLINKYLINAEKTLRILHIPSFLREHQHFWETRKPSASEYFLPQLCAVTLVGSAWDETEYFISKSGDRGDVRSALCELVAAWLDDLDWKSRITLSTLRTQCLLILALQICQAVPVETVWIRAGAVVRAAITMGLHRDPSEFPDISIFEGECRRRLWMTIAENDLQLSLLSGCPPMVRDGDFTTSPPSNVDDLELYEEMKDYPVPKPLDEWTDASLQVILSK